jgi:hypothetical protein
MPGDTIILMDGTYGAPSSCTGDPNHGGMAVNISTGGTSGSPITLKGMNRWGAVLDAALSCHSYINFDSNANYWIIEDLEIKNRYWGGIWSNAAGGGQGVVIRGNHIHDIGRRNDTSTYGIDGIFLGTSSNPGMTIDGNIIHDIGRTNDYTNSFDHGIYSYGNMTIVNNVFFNTWKGWGIQAAPGFQGTIANNTFYGPNGYRGGTTKDGQIALWGQAGGTISITNNTFDLPYLAAIHYNGFLLAGAGCNASYNIAHGQGVIPIVINGDSSGGNSCNADATNKATNDSTTDPIFVSTTLPLQTSCVSSCDFHLQGSSLQEMPEQPSTKRF